MSAAPASDWMRASAQGELRSFKLAAALLLTRAGAAGSELYLVRRSPHLAVFPGFWAFPGGGLDACDGDGHAGQLAPFLRCALRELFEETGVLGAGLAPLLPVEQAERRAHLRAQLSAREREGLEGPLSEWAALLERAREPFAGLEPFCWATTPDFARVRFRALYAHLELPAGEQPSVLPGELVEGRFWSADELWRGWLAGELWLVPPVVYFVEQLVRERDLERAKRAAGLRSAAIDAGRLHAVQPVPGICVAALPTPTLPPARTTNCAIVGRDPAYVIDPATWDERARAQLLAWLDEERASGLRVAGVIATHHHRDHVGSIAAVARHCGVPVLAHARTLERLPEAPASARELVDGDELALGRAPDGAPDWRLVAWHTPEHDAGHLVLRESRYRTLIAGDLVSTLSTIVIEPPEGHLATYLASLQRVRALGLRALVPAHGNFTADGAALIGRYLEHRAMRERLLVEALVRHGPAAPAQLLPEVYADTPAALHPLAALSLQAGLEKLAEEGRARREGERWSAIETPPAGA